MTATTMDSKKSLPSDLKITTTEMHTGGEPLRIIESGYPKPEGVTILDKRAWLRAHADDYRKLLMFEPRGHYDMYGALLVTPDLPEADIGVIFMHNEGYSTMCGHGVIALGRYLVDRGLVAAGNPEARVIIQCPCGPVTAHVTHSNGVTSDVRFTNVPSYVFALEALKAKVKLHHPDSPDLAFIYGTIVTDGGDHTINSTDGTTTNICVFAEKEVDRSPCGSGVAARVALQYHRGVLPLGQKRQFRSGVTGSEFTARALKTVEVKGAGMEGKDVIAILPEVSGRAFYTGSNTFTVETEDPLVGGFLPR
ncbi:trans-L-3-hydroxyproline dehydratase-like isoform X2 [Littorina saxatilis]|uniref:trans-L-3-hydroxyproline dehydratase-like isoform X2 n=1 Tax=Littorina saxatilis TaxID=31220 RepID=UPI0038B4C5E8